MSKLETDSSFLYKLQHSLNQMQSSLDSITTRMPESNDCEHTFFI